MILNRIRPAINPQLRTNQNELRPNSSSVVQDLEKINRRSEREELTSSFDIY
jgi:hypothetical protein